MRVGSLPGFRAQLLVFDGQVWVGIFANPPIRSESLDAECAVTRKPIPLVLSWII